MSANSDLSRERCQACRGDVPQVDAQTQKALLEQIPGWSIIAIDGVDRLTKSFHFSDFKQALIFSNVIGELAEAIGHHPEIVTAWGKVTVSWWTHKIGGLHRNDFIVAAKTDRLNE